MSTTSRPGPTPTGAVERPNAYDPHVHEESAEPRELNEQRTRREACPLCGHRLNFVFSATCAQCGLWWVASVEANAARPAAAEAVSEICLRLKANTDIAFWVVVSLFAAVGYGTLLFCIWNLAGGPPNVLTLVALLCGLPLGGLLAFPASEAIVQHALELAVPGRIDGDRLGLRLRAWRSGSGFRRVDVLVPRSAIVGVGFWSGQGYETHLFLVHACGCAFATGWAGTRQRADAYAEVLQRWIAFEENQAMGPTAMPADAQRGC